MAETGFIIPLNLADYLAQGQRNNWCSTQTWWTNENISLLELGPLDPVPGPPA